MEKNTILTMRRCTPSNRHAKSPTLDVNFVTSHASLFSSLSSINNPQGVETIICMYPPSRCGAHHCQAQDMMELILSLLVVKVGRGNLHPDGVAYIVSPLWRIRTIGVVLGVKEDGTVLGCGG